MRTNLILSTILALTMGTSLPAYAKSPPRQAVDNAEDDGFYADPVQTNSNWKAYTKDCAKTMFDEDDASCKALETIANEATSNNLCYGFDNKWSTCKYVGPKFWLQQYYIANGPCRDGHPELCYIRDAASQKMESFGWCYGREGQIEADKRWEKCTRGSIHTPARNPQ